MLGSVEPNLSHWLHGSREHHAEEAAAGEEHFCADVWPEAELGETSRTC